MFTREDVLERARKERVKFIRLQFYRYFWRVKKYRGNGGGFGTGHGRQGCLRQFRG